MVLLGGAKCLGSGDSYLVLYRGASINLIRVIDLDGATTWTAISSLDLPISESHWKVQLIVSRKNDVTNLELTVDDKKIQLSSSNNSSFDIPVGGYIGGSVSFPELTTASGEVKISNLGIATYNI